MREVIDTDEDESETRAYNDGCLDIKLSRYY